MTGALSFVDNRETIATESAPDFFPPPLPLDTTPHFAINGRFLCQPVTGVQRVAREIVREIDALIAEGVIDARVDLYCPLGAQTGSMQLKAIRVHAVGPFQGACWEQITLPRHAAGVPLLCLGNSAPIPTLLSQGRVGVMIHDLSYLHFGHAYRLSYRLAHRLMLPLLLKRAQRIFLVSRTEEMQLRQIAPGIETRLVVAQNGVRSMESKKPYPDVEVPFDGGYGLYVGAFSHRKNFPRVIDVAVQLAREEGLPFVFVGSAPDILCEPRVEVPEDVSHLIHFAGQVDDTEKLGAYYRGARYLLFPSLYEASPLPPLEAASFDCPVVAPNIPSIWERCGDGVEYCDPMRTDSIIAAVRRVLEMGPAVRSQIDCNRAMAQALSWRTQAKKVSAAMLELCSRDA